MPVPRKSTATVLEAEVLEALRRMPSDHFVAVITDPPYGLSEPPPAAEVLRQWLDTGDYLWPRKGGGFMGAAWDRFVPGPVLWREIYRVLRPGGIVLCFAGARTDHWMAMSAELAGFQKIDGIPWINGQGFPKVSDMGKLIDRQRHDRAAILGCTKWIRERCDALGLKAADLDRACGTAGMGGHWISRASQPYVPTREQWAKLEPLLGAMPPDMEAQRLIIDAREPGEAFKRREVIGVRRAAQPGDNASTDFFGKAGGEVIDTLPATDEAVRWTGWASLLKPGNEPLIVLRKPTKGTLVANVLEHGCGALHVDACRLPVDPSDPVNTAIRTVTASAFREGTTGFVSNGIDGERRSMAPPSAGRWPPNVLFTHSPDCDEDACVEYCPVVMLDEQSGERRSGSRAAGVREGLGYGGADGDGGPAIEGSIGGASRFFWAGRHAQPTDLDGFKYAAKARRRDRDAGLPRDILNRHPTVKPQAVADWCARLVGSDAGPILVPFAGSGTEARACTLLGFDVVAIEREIEYAELTRLRCGLPETETANWIRLRDRLRDAAIPRQRKGKKKGKAIRPETPGVPLIKAWGDEGRAACKTWLELTGGDARIAPPPQHMAEWTKAYTPPDGHPATLPGKLHGATVAIALDPGDEPSAELAGAIEAAGIAALVEAAKGGDGAEAAAEALAEHLEGTGLEPGDFVDAALASAAERVRGVLAADLREALDRVAEDPTPIPWESTVELEQAAAMAGPATLIAELPTEPPTESPPGGRTRRKRKAPAGFAAAADAATLDGDPLGPDGAELRPDGPARLAEVIAAAAFGPAPVEPSDEVAAAQARGRAAIAALPPMPARYARPGAPSEQLRRAIEQRAEAGGTLPPWASGAVVTDHNRRTNGEIPRATASGGVSCGSLDAAGDASRDEALEGAAAHATLDGPNRAGGDERQELIDGGVVHCENSLTAPTAAVKAPTPIYFEPPPAPPADFDPWAEELPAMFAARP